MLRGFYEKRKFNKAIKYLEELKANIDGESKTNPEDRILQIIKYAVLLDPNHGGKIYLTRGDDGSFSVSHIQNVYGWELVGMPIDIARLLSKLIELDSLESKEHIDCSLTPRPIGEHKDIYELSFSAIELNASKNIFKKRTRVVE